ncbi:hypothetical protein [Streptomyces sp. NPDC048584]|uniref:hypothetical protein n=1 Tax=Streptomyces sp. NPDC048584 TaxID=3365573 RepID=UPI0037186188
MNSSKHTELANHAWSVADLLRGDYKFKSNLDRSARRAAWRMIRREEGLDDF